MSYTSKYAQVDVSCLAGEKNLYSRYFFAVSRIKKLLPLPVIQTNTHAIRPV